ncbi:MAG TPA: alpha/beta fold hydrolase [Arsenicitalea sp.]|jgi:pimeloyl-ACP methyl ester carboxylesterase|nr:alpha/beta fold hydrolase [Arsenicitalea sp.]
MTQTPFLLVPGLNCTAEIFKAQIPIFWRFGPVTIANHTEGANIAEIAASILANAPPRFALAGFSMGGYIAFEILRQAGERVEKLCFIGTSARPDTAEATETRLARIALARAGQFEQAVNAGFPTAVHPDQLERADLRALLLRMATSLGPELFERHQRAIIHRPDSRGDLAGIKLKTLVLVGEADQTAVPAAAQEMAAGIAGSRLVVIPRAGHMAPIEQPEAVNAALGDWLSS